MTILILLSHPQCLEAATENPHTPFKVSCNQCHIPSSWTELSPNIQFDHNRKTGFPLAGSHEDVQCVACHKSVKFYEIGVLCMDCHQDPHKGENGIRCLDCHTETSWQTNMELSVSLKHAEVGFPLMGRHRSLSCLVCHSRYPKQFKENSQACVSCHQSDYNQTANPNHNSAGFSMDCQSCHTAVSWESASFDHSTTGFALTGAHGTVNCSSCHSTGYQGTSSECSACHMSDYNQTKNPDHSLTGYPTDCQTCHTATNWESASFDHSTTGFALTGAHGTVNCSSCHSNGYQGTASECSACHQTDYNQTTNPNHSSAGFSTDCQTCHTSTSWAGSFDHSSTGFVLTGAHGTVNCSSCHSTGYQGTASECSACHMSDYNQTNNPNHSLLGYPTDCQTCHTATSWESASFDHSSTGFALTGAHGTVNCSTCHSNGYQGTSSECSACHQTDYNQTTNPNHSSAGFSTDCQTCHTSTSWAGSFDHSSTGFALTGAHETVNCSSCHSTGYQGTSSECSACHLSDYNQTTDPNHSSAGYPTECQSCHTATTWGSASFDHSTTGFTLTGAHRTVTCSSCHSNGYQGTSSSCSSCHMSEYNQTRDPNHSAANFSTSCQTCHSTNNWNSNWSHSDFPIYSGKHRGTWSSCSTCHKNSSNYSDFTCTSCHAHNQFSMTREHDEVRNFQYSSMACYNCHPDGRD